MKSHKERYKSIQVNMSLSKHKDLIEWLVKRADDEETSLNSIIIRVLKKEFKRNEKEND